MCIGSVDFGFCWIFSRYTILKHVHQHVLHQYMYKIFYINVATRKHTLIIIILIIILYIEREDTLFFLQLFSVVNNANAWSELIRIGWLWFFKINLYAF